MRKNPQRGKGKIYNWFMTMVIRMNNSKTHVLLNSDINSDIILTEIFSRFEIRKCAVDLNARISTLKKYITTLALYIILR